MQSLNSMTRQDDDYVIECKMSLWLEQVKVIMSFCCLELYGTAI